jgi:psp operon transcriptional activator
VRELRNVVERAVYRWDDWDSAIGEIVFDPFDSAWRPPRAPEPSPVQPRFAKAPADGISEVQDLRAAVDAYERTIVEQHLARHRFNQRRCAQALGLSYDQLRHTMRKHGLLERGRTR